MIRHFNLVTILAALLPLARTGLAQSVYPQAYTFSTLAGFAAGNGSVDGVGTDAQFAIPAGVAVDSSGNVFVADSQNREIRQITPPGVVTTIAGAAGSFGNMDGPGSVARFLNPIALTVDAARNVYVADLDGFVIRKLTLSGTNWLVSTIAGLAGNQGTNDGTGTNALFYNPFGIAVDLQTNLYVSDNATVRKISPVGSNWVVTTIAGLAGTPDSVDGTNDTARFISPIGLAVDPSSNIYVADLGNSTIRKINPAGTNWVVTTIAGTAGVFNSADGTNGAASFNGPNGLAIDAAGNLYVGDADNNTVRKITHSGTNWIVTTLAGTAGQAGDQTGTGSNALFSYPEGVAVDTSGNVYVADHNNSKIRQITSAGVVSTFGGSGNSPSIGSLDGAGASARFNTPSALAVDAAGYVYVADTENYTIRKVTPAGAVTTLAGSAGVTGYSNGIGNFALFSIIQGLALDSQDNIYVADTFNDTIRKITSAGVVTTLAGLAQFNQYGFPIGGTNDGITTNAQFNLPQGIALDTNGNVYVADSQNFTIRKVTPAGVVSTLAGKALAQGLVDGTNLNAQFKFPFAVAADNSGQHLYVADGIAVRLLSHQGTNWVVSTIAGSMTAGSADGIGTNAQFAMLTAIVIDKTGNLFVADRPNDVIRKLTLTGSDWVVTTVGGTAELAGDADGVGKDARFNYPRSVTVDSAGNLYVADSFNNTIRKGVFTQFGVANPVAYSQPATNGQLKVTLLPPEANGQWRFPWEVAWHGSGYTAAGLAAGNYPVEFRHIPGWLAIPASLTSTNPAVVTSGLTQITNYYYPTVAPSDANAAAGTLTVFLGANPPVGAGWRFLGDTNAFFTSGFSTNLLPGVYLIEFAGPFSGRATPPNASVQLLAGQPTFIQVAYSFASAPPAGVFLPVPVPANEISDVADYPFGFNGQLQTDVGYGSGVVVQSNVVLTAAHLLFNDETLSYAVGAYWFMQKNAPQYSPSPVAARGWYLLSGYAAQRTNDLSSGTYGPDVSSPQSRNLDVAALYFPSAVAGGGFGGYLPSDEVPNQWLTGTEEKMLVGYPVDASQNGFTNFVPDQMYAIGPQTNALALSSDAVTNQQEVYTAPWFLSYPGNSGGPFYVQLNGYFYPAAVYLGTLNGQSVVRAIDSNVVSLITQAGTLGDNGTNNNGGGVITIIPNQLISAVNPGYLQVQLGPPSAVQAGAAWLLQPGTNYSTTTNFTQAIFSPNAVALQFKPIPGWNVPTNQSVVVVPGNIAYPPAFYTVNNPVLLVNGQGIGLTGTTNTTYRIEKSPALAGPWTGVTTNTIVSNGFNLVAPKTNNPTTTFYRAVWLNR